MVKFALKPQTRLWGAFFGESERIMYQFEFEYDYQDMVTLNHVYSKTYGRRWMIVLTVFGIVVGIVSLLMAVLLIAFHSDEPLWSMIVNRFLLSALLLTGWFWWPWLNAIFSKRMLLKGAGTLTVTLDEKGEHDHNAKGESQHPWSSFVSAYHCRMCYLLLLDKRHAIVLPERALVAGDPATLRAFLEEKLQKEIIEVR